MHVTNSSGHAIKRLSSIFIVRSFRLYYGSSFTVLDMPFYGLVSIVVRSVLCCQRQLTAKSKRVLR